VIGVVGVGAMLFSGGGWLLQFGDRCLLHRATVLVVVLLLRR
jgi:hypothetical protein